MARDCYQNNNGNGKGKDQHPSQYGTSKGKGTPGNREDAETHGKKATDGTVGSKAKVKGKKYQDSNTRAIHMIRPTCHTALH